MFPPNHISAWALTFIITFGFLWAAWIAWLIYEFLNAPLVEDEYGIEFRYKHQAHWWRTDFRGSFKEAEARARVWRHEDCGLGHEYRITFEGIPVFSL